MYNEGTNIVDKIKHKIMFERRRNAFYVKACKTKNIKLEEVTEMEASNSIVGVAWASIILTIVTTVIACVILFKCIPKKCIDSRTAKVAMTIEFILYELILNMIYFYLLSVVCSGRWIIELLLYMLINFIISVCSILFCLNNYNYAEKYLYMLSIIIATIPYIFGTYIILVMH